MIRKTLVVGPLQCNCTLLGCEETKEAVLIDPGDEAERIVQMVESEGLKIKYLLHTHAHFDHIGGTKEVKKSCAGTVCLHKQDEFLYNMLPTQGRLFGMKFEAAPPVEKFLNDEEEISFGGHRLQVLHTPGHSPGSICLKLQGAEGCLFSGDTLFKESVGRTDLWGGDTDLLLKSIRNRIFALDDDLKVYPGHGPSTLVGKEKRTNPFLT